MSFGRATSTLLRRISGRQLGRKQCRVMRLGLIWNGGQVSAGDDDGPAGLSTWINAAVWRALTADTVDTTPGGRYGYAHS